MTVVSRSRERERERERMGGHGGWMMMRTRLGSEGVAAAFRLPRRRAARSVVGVVHARVRVVVRSRRITRAVQPTLVFVSSRCACGDGLYRVNRVRVGTRGAIEPGEFLGEDHAGTFGISLVVGWTGESVDEAEFLRAREAFDGHLAPRGGGPVARRLGVPQAHGGSPRSAFAPRRAYRSVARCVAGRPR